MVGAGFWGREGEKRGKMSMGLMVGYLVGSGVGRGIDVGVEGSFWGRGRLVESEVVQAIRSRSCR